MAKNGFSALTSGSNTFTRRFGGNSLSNTIDPYITGYSFIKFGDFPNGISRLTGAVSTADTPISLSEGECRRYLESSVLSVTLPAATMNTTEFNGLGGVKYTVPTYADHDTTFSMRFFETQGLPLLTIISSWFRMMRDYRYGVSADLQGTNYTKGRYSGSMYYWTTLPDGKTVQMAALLTGIYPTRDPVDQYGHDITAIDKLELDIDFNVDYVWREREIANTCQSFANTYSSNGISTINGYRAADATI